MHHYAFLFWQLVWFSLCFCIQFHGEVGVFLSHCSWHIKRKLMFLGSRVYYCTLLIISCPPFSFVSFWTSFYLDNRWMTKSCILLFLPAFSSLSPFSTFWSSSALFFNFSVEFFFIMFFMSTSSFTFCWIILHHFCFVSWMQCFLLFYKCYNDTFSKLFHYVVSVSFKMLLSVCFVLCFFYSRYYNHIRWSLVVCLCVCVRVCVKNT